MASNFLTYSQISDDFTEQRRAHAVSLVGTGVGDGVRIDFGVFAVTQGTLHNDDSDAVNAKASALVARVVASEVLQNYYHQELEEVDDLPAVNDILQAAIQKANQQVQQEVDGGVSSVVAVVIVGTRLYLINIGRGCAFLLSEDGIQRLTSEPTNGATDPLSLIGGSEEVPPTDVAIKYLPPHSTILLSNADVWEMNEIDKIIRHAPSIHQASETLRDSAPESYRPDIAGVMIRVGVFEE